MARTTVRITTHGHGVYEQRSKQEHRESTPCPRERQATNLIQNRSLQPKPIWTTNHEKYIRRRDSKCMEQGTTTT
jgi:hypothetical protein